MTLPLRYGGSAAGHSRRARRLLGAVLVVSVLVPTAACSWSSAASQQSQLTIVAASSLTGTFSQLQRIFQRQHPGVHVAISYGSSTTLAEQVVSGAPADVIATADRRSISIVARKNLLRRAPVAFATNTLALVTPPSNPAHVRSLQDLNSADFVMCDPTAPCGAAAQEVLHKAGVTNQPKSLEVDAKSVLAKVTLNAADAGLVYVSDAYAARRSVHTIAIPAKFNTVNKYYAAAVRGSTAPALAQQWVALLTSRTGQRVLRAAKFGPP